MCLYFSAAATNAAFGFLWEQNLPLHCADMIALNKVLN